MHIHILGICGTFMGGIASLAREAGHRVTGCDQNVYPPMSDQLRALGIDLIEGYDADQLAIRPDLWVIGNVVSRGNPLMEALLDQGAPYVSGPQWLAEHILPGRWVMAVAGTHGKTTTSAMLAWILERAGLSPGYLIGGVPVDLPGTARHGRGTHFVIEADEYDTAFFDKRSKFLHYRPRTLVLNNLEFDHADIFADLEAIETQFHHVVRTVPRAGRIIANAQSPALGRVLARGLWSEHEPFLSEDGWHAQARSGDPLTLELALGTQHLGTGRPALPGAHNRANAIAAIAAAHHAGVAPQSALAALESFAGVRRRLEHRGQVGGVSVIDDFAHHPTAIEATIAALREDAGSQGRILAVIEPRSNTMRLGAMRSRLAAALQGADLVFCYTGGIRWDAAEDLAPLGARAYTDRELPALVAKVAGHARSGDRILVMSNGGFGGIHQQLLDALGARP